MPVPSRRRPRILISNDDGYQAPGLVCLAAYLTERADVDVVAPERNRSGASNSLTLELPLRAQRAANGFIHVEGTPTDCVHLALTGLLEHEPDLVVSGINAGPNLGDDVLYSGTVAAAMEGRHLGLPAIAISMMAFDAVHYLTAAHVAWVLIEKLDTLRLPPSTILNVNVPDVSWEDLRGMQVTRLGARHKAEPAHKALDPRGKPIYWVGPPGPAQDAGPGTDFHAVANGFVSVTPVQVDLTRHDALGMVGAWLGAL